MLNLASMALFKTDTQLIGLDLGTSGIRVVQLKGAGERGRLVTYGAMAMDPQVMVSDSTMDRRTVVDAIKQLLAQSKASTRNVIAGMPSAKVFSALINLPKMTPAELEKGIRYQAEQHVPMAMDQVKLDWLLAGESADGKTQEVLIVAVPVTLAERTLAVLEAAELEVAAIEPDAFALARALVKPQDVAVTVLDVGASSTDLVTIHNRVPKLIRSIPVGGDSFVKAASQTLNLDMDQAFQFVYKFGLAQSKMEGQVKRAIKSSVDGLVSELTKSTKFFEAHYKNVKISKVVLTGKATMIPEFPAYLANNTLLPVEIGDAWGQIDTPADLSQRLTELSNQFAVACGLALRGNS